MNDTPSEHTPKVEDQTQKSREDVSNGNGQPSSDTSSGHWKLSNLLDPKIIAAVIAAAATITTGTIIYLGQRSPEDEIKIEEGRKQVQVESERKAKVLTSFEEATTAIQRMMDDIRDVTDNPQKTYSEAAQTLGQSSQALLTTYGKFCLAVCGKCGPDCSFHKAKEAGRHAAIWVQAQEQTSKVSEDIRKDLRETRVKLSTFRTEIEALGKAQEGRNQ